MADEREKIAHAIETMEKAAAFYLKSGGDPVLLRNLQLNGGTLMDLYNLCWPIVEDRNRDEKTVSRLAAVARRHNIRRGESTADVMARAILAGDMEAADLIRSLILEAN